MRMCIYPGESGVKRAAATHLAHKLTEEQELGLKHFTQRRQLDLGQSGRGLHVLGCRSPGSPRKT